MKRAPEPHRTMQKKLCFQGRQKTISLRTESTDFFKKAKHSSLEPFPLIKLLTASSRFCVCVCKVYLWPTRWLIVINEN